MPELFSAFLFTISPGVFAATDAECKAYANNALQQLQQARSIGVPNLDPPTWVNDYNAHYNWCMPLPKMIADMANAQRQQIIDQHQASPSAAPPSSPAVGRGPGAGTLQGVCQQYADTALKQLHEAQSLGMPDLNPPVWSTNHQGHQDWCMQASRSAANSETARRQKIIDAHGAGSQQGLTVGRERFAQPGMQPVPLALKPRSLPRKPAKSVYYKGLYANQLVVKFKDGARVRAIRSTQAATASQTGHVSGRRGRLALDKAGMRPRDRNQLARQGLSERGVDADLERVNSIFGRRQVNAWRPLFSRTGRQLEADRARVERSTRTEFSDLANYYMVMLGNGSDGVAVVDELNALQSVEIAYLMPIGEDADLPPATQDYSSGQGYLDPAPDGIDALFAWTRPGGAGKGVRIIDIEQGWMLYHEDLGSSFMASGLFTGDGNHGTAVLGELVAREDNHGITGIAHDAEFGVVSTWHPFGQSQTFGTTELLLSGKIYSLADAVNVAADALRSGDIILIEQHARGPGDDRGCACNCKQYRYIAMEYWQATFDAIQAATAKGIVVVEVAGNGGQNLDDRRYERRFDRTFRDSGALMVGAGHWSGASSPRSATCWSNYGSRVDLQGWGENVMTLGHSDNAHTNIEVSGTDNRQWYTSGFGGTSSAAPMVAGAAAILQGVQKAKGYAPLTPKEVRARLVSTGTPLKGNKKIGPLPDLRKVLETYVHTKAPPAPQPEAKERAPAAPELSMMSIPCKRYAEQAVAQNDENMWRKCRLSGPKWKSDYKWHYDWCVHGENVKHAQAESEKRAAALKACP